MDNEALSSEEQENTSDALSSDDQENSGDAVSSEEQKNSGDALSSDDQENSGDTVSSEEQEKSGDAVSSEEQENSGDALPSEDQENSGDLLENIRMDNLFQKQYEMNKWLGGGGFSQVYLCKNVVDQQMYAVKMIPIIPEGAFYSVIEFLLECVTMSQVDHPNIARYHHAWIEGGVPPFLDAFVRSLEKGSGASYCYNENAYGEEGFGFSDFSEKKADGSSIEKGSGNRNSSKEKADVSTEKSFDPSDFSEKKADGSSIDHSDFSEEKGYHTLFIAMKMYSRSLKDKIGKLSMKVIRRIFDGVLSALLHLNKLHIVHGDIKPDNILLDEDYNPKFTDFGSSFIAGGAVKMGGTDGYIGKNEEATHATDLYALGLTLLQVICSQLELGSEMEGLVKHIKNGESPTELMKADAGDHVKLTVFRILNESPPPNIADLAATELDMEAVESEDIALGLLESTSQDLC